MGTAGCGHAIVWRNVVLMGLLHLGAVYALSLVPRAQLLTLLWGECGGGVGLRRAAPRHRWGRGRGGGFPTSGTTGRLPPVPERRVFSADPAGPAVGEQAASCFLCIRAAAARRLARLVARVRGQTWAGRCAVRRGRGRAPLAARQPPPLLLPSFPPAAPGMPAPLWAPGC